MSLLPLSSSTTTTSSVLKSPLFIKTTSSQNNLYGFRRNHHLLQFRSSLITRAQPLKPCSSVNFSGGFPFKQPLLGFSLQRKLGFFPIGSENGDGDGETKKEVVDELEEKEEVRKETPNSPMIWPWFIGTSLYALWAIYSYIVKLELTYIIVHASVVLATAEAMVPDSVKRQSYLLTVTGIVGFATLAGIISESLFWVFLVGFFYYSMYVKGRDIVSSALHSAAVWAAFVEPWRMFAMGSYITLAIYQHSKKLSEENEKLKVTTTVRRILMPLLAAAFAIGIHVAA